MIKQSMLIVAAVLAFSGIASADMSGRWSGQAEYWTSDYGVMGSYDVAADIQVMGEFLYFTSEDPGGSWSIPVTLEIQGNDLLDNGMKIGSIDDYSVEFDHYIAPGFSYSAKIRSSGGDFADFEDHAYWSDGFEDSFSGTLSRYLSPMKSTKGAPVRMHRVAR